MKKVLFIASILLLFFPGVSFAYTDHLVISQVQITGGPGLTTNDFIEIYNPTGSDIDLNGLRLVKRANTSETDTLIKSWTEPTVIPAHGFYLWANSDFTTITVPADITTSLSIADDNGIALRRGANDTGEIIDSVAWGETANVFVEGSVFPTNPAANESLERSADTNNNAADFALQSTPHPRNSQGEIDPPIVPDLPDGSSGSTPETGCEDERVANQLISSAPEEDGTVAFSYGEDNLSFASKDGSELALNVNLLFTTAPTTTVKVYFMNSNCFVVSALAFEQQWYQEVLSTFAYNLTTQKLSVNGEPGFPITANGPVRYMWLEVLDKYPFPGKASVSYIVDVLNVQNPVEGGEEEEEPAEPEEEPLPQPSGPVPVIIIPGIMGSELYQNDDLIWPDIDRLIASPLDGFLSESLNLDEDGESIRNITVANVIKSIDLGFTDEDVFDGLLTHLDGEEYIAGENLFLFAYDWRLDLNETQWLLHEKIEEIKDLTGFDQVDIVAHSLGGLLAQNYIRYNGAENINKLIFIGTPHLGAPKSVLALITGDAGFPYKIVNASRVKEISLNSPSVYQLLPNQTYFDVYQGYIRSVGEILSYQETQNFLIELEKNSGLLARTEQFHGLLETTNFGDIDLYNIVGCKQASMKDLYTITAAGKVIGSAPSNGDGTVPFVSADYLSTDATAYYVKNGVHSNLPSMNGVRQMIVDILQNEPPSLISGIGTEPVFCPISGKELNWRSPVEVHIYDELGNHAGPLSNGIIEIEIPGVTYEFIGEEAYIFLPTDEGQVYSVEGTGTGSGTFDLIISEILNDEITNVTLFDNVEIVVGSEIGFNVSASTENTDINLDFNNDGEVSIVDFNSQSGSLEEILTLAIAEPEPDTEPEQDYQPVIGGGGGGAPPALPVDTAPESGMILGEEITVLPDGTLVLDMSDGKTIYMIGRGGRKYGFASDEAFVGQGFKWEEVISTDLSTYELGGIIKYPDQAHPNGSLVWDGQTIWHINYEKKYGFSTMEEFLQQGFHLSQVVSMNEADKLLTISYE